MKRAGEYERILIRRAFLNWDADASGKLNRREFMGAMRQVGIALTEEEAEKVVLFYDFDGDQEMRYQPLVDDVTAGAPHFMHHPDGSKDGAKSGGGGGGGGDGGGMAKKSGRKGGGGRHGGGGSSPAEDHEADPDDLLLAKMFTTRPVERQKNCVVEAFKINLRRRLEDHIRAVGGTIISILREAFLFWDCDSSGELNPDEFRGAMSRLGLHITADEASQVRLWSPRDACVPSPTPSPSVRRSLELCSLRVGSSLVAAEPSRAEPSRAVDFGVLTTMLPRLSSRRVASRRFSSRAARSSSTTTARARTGGTATTRSRTRISWTTSRRARCTLWTTPTRRASRRRRRWSTRRAT